MINSKHGKHKNHDILNLIGYGLAKFDTRFVSAFGFKTKNSFFEYVVKIGIAETVGTVKNRQDLFDPFFDSGRKGWWQKGDAYIHRKIFIDSLFGTMDCKSFVDVVKLYLEKGADRTFKTDKSISPILKSKFKQLQITGQEAELFFMRNYETIDYFRDGTLEDARLFGDGYDFQIEVKHRFYLAEIKGLRTHYGSVRLTENEFLKAKEYQNEYALVVVCNLIDIPKFGVVFNPTENLSFQQKEIKSKQISYHTKPTAWIN
jgi:hypothetical protein